MANASVAIGRVIAREPRKLFLFDEPLSNLDAALRGQTRVEIANPHEQLDTTLIYMTHDQISAMTLTDRVVVLNAGRIEQVGTPVDRYERPPTIGLSFVVGTTDPIRASGKVVHAEALVVAGIQIPRAIVDADRRDATSHANSNALRYLCAARKPLSATGGA